MRARGRLTATRRPPSVTSPSLVAVTHRDAVRVALALRAHDVVDLLLHQLAQHAEPDATLSASSPSFAAPTSSPSASCTRAGNTSPPARSRRARPIRSPSRRFSFDLERIASHAPNGNGRGGGTATSSSTSYGTTSSRRTRRAGSPRAHRPGSRRPRSEDSTPGERRRCTARPGSAVTDCTPGQRMTVRSLVCVPAFASDPDDAPTPTRRAATRARARR